MKFYLTRNQSATGASNGVQIDQLGDFDQASFQAAVTGTGAVSATVVIEVSNDPTLMGWVALSTITLSGTTTATDGFAVNAPWQHLMANVTAISGTGAVVSAVMGA